MLVVCAGLCWTGNLYAANPTQTENAKPGSPDWQLTNPATNHEIEGYASLTSVNRGGQISFFVNTADPTFTVEVFRMGWYGGAGARRMMAPVQQTGTRQTIPTPNPTTGIIECQWINPYVLAIPYNGGDPTVWASGVYLARLTGNTSGKQSFIIFVVRDDARTSPYVFQLSVNTFQAYNNWGGKSLYAWNSTGPQAANVSFDRPYAVGYQSNSGFGVGAGEFLTNDQPSNPEGAPAGWSYNMLRFLEREGYDVTYITDVDAHEDRSLLTAHRAVLVVGHSEYWSWQMRNNVEFARDSGIGIGFFSSNTCYWQIRFAASARTGAPDRTIIAYKENAAQDPYASNPSLAYLTTTQWRNAPVNRPEDAFVGVAYRIDGVNGDIVVSNASHWVYTFTGLQNGAHLPGMLGYEVDSMLGNQPASTVGVAHELAAPGTNSDSTVYTTASGTPVFAAGSFQWSWGLDDFNTPNIRPSVLNPAAQQITRNILAGLVGLPLSPGFSLVPSPRARSVYPGSSISYTIATTAFGYSPTLTLSLTGLPANIPYTFTPPTVSGSGSSTLTISPGQSAPLGTYVLTISASDGTQTRTESVSLTISQIIDKTGWRLVYVDSQETQCENGAAVNAFDNNPATMWHTHYCGGIVAQLPHEMQIDMGAGYPINTFRYLPRQDGGVNGRIGQFEFYATNNLSSWGTALATGTFADDATEKQVTFASGTYRYIRLRALTSTNGGPYTSMAELTVLAPTGSSPLASIAVTPTNPTITIGTTQQFTATGTYQDGTTQNITSQVLWSASTSAVTITAGGLATGQSAGSATITAAQGSVTGSTTATVPTPVLVSIAVTPSNPTINVGATQQFTATGTYQGGGTQNITSQVVWSASTAAVTITAGGLATGQSTGSATITAAQNGVSGSTTATVSPALVSIAVTPSNPTINIGATQQFTATGTYQGGSTQNITSQVAWSASTGAVTITAGGLATGQSAGSATITAAKNGVTGSTTATVPGPALVSIAVTPSNPTIGVGATQQFTATGTYQGGGTQNITSQVAWSASTAAVTITAGGLATGQSPGSATVTAALNGVTGTTTATVPSVVPKSGWTLVFVDSQETQCENGAAVNGFDNNTATIWHTQYCGTTAQLPHEIQIDMATGYLINTFRYLPRQDSGTYGRIGQFEFYATNNLSSWGTPVATGTFANDATEKQVTFTAGTYRYIRLRALTEVSGAPYTSMAELTVLQIGSGPPLMSIAVTPSNPTIGVGATQQFTATGTYQGGSTQNITSQVAWSASTAAVTINAGGLATGQSAGSATITAALNGVTGSTTATVPTAVLVSIAVTPSNPAIGVGATQQFTATGTYQGGGTQNITSQVSWSSSTAAVTITAGGLATGRSAGSATITAALNGVTGSTTATVPSVVPKTNWALVFVDSQETSCENGAAVNGFDGLASTMWHTAYCFGSAQLPHEIQIDMGSGYQINTFRYLPRQDGGVNGRIGRFEFYATNNLSSWGTPVATGTFANDATEKQITFTLGTYRYIRLRALTEANGGPWTSMAELTVLQP